MGKVGLLGGSVDVEGGPSAPAALEREPPDILASGILYPQEVYQNLYSEVGDSRKPQ